MVCGSCMFTKKRRISAWNRREIEGNLGGAAKNLDKNGVHSHQEGKIFLEIGKFLIKNMELWNASSV